MGLNALSVRYINQQRQNKAIEEVLKKKHSHALYIMKYAAV